MPEVPRLMSRREVAALFGVSPHTIYRWAREGRLPVLMTLGGRRRYPTEEIMRLAEAQGLGGRLEARTTSEARTTTGGRR